MPTNNHSKNNVAKLCALALLSISITACANNSAQLTTSAESTVKPAVAKVSPLPISNAVKWQTQSKEYAFLTSAIYQQGTNSLKQLETTPSNWVVVMDVDETVLDNSAYQVGIEQKGESYSSATWASWVASENATLVPGVAGFIQAVFAKGGKVALITNRNKPLDEHTWRNLLAQGLPLSAENTCLVGRSASDKSAVGQANIVNDKDLRRQQVINGTADCYQVDANAKPPKAWAAKQAIIMEVGDNIEDFSQVTQEEADLDTLVPQWPQKLILLPNPMYGSW